MEANNTQVRPIILPSARPPPETPAANSRPTAPVMNSGQRIILPSSLLAPSTATPLADAIIAQAASRHGSWAPGPVRQVEFATMEKGVDGIHMYALAEGFALVEKRKNEWGTPCVVRQIIYHCAQGGFASCADAHIQENEREQESGLFLQAKIEYDQRSLENREVRRVARLPPESPKVNDHGTCQPARGETGFAETRGWYHYDQDR